MFPKSCRLPYWLVFHVALYPSQVSKQLFCFFFPRTFQLLWEFWEGERERFLAQLIWEHDTLS